jgi:hypothetical protein
MLALRDQELGEWADNDPQANLSLLAAGIGCIIFAGLASGLTLG